MSRLTGRPTARIARPTAAAEVRQLRIRGLRHTAATALLFLGRDSRTIMAVKGWSAQSLVARYAHIVPDLRRRVAAKQGTLFLNDAAALVAAAPGLVPVHTAATLDEGDGRLANRALRKTPSRDVAAGRKRR